MRIKKKILTRSLLILVVSIISGCAPQYSTKVISSQITHSPFTRIIEKTSTKTLNIYPTPTDLPTQSPSQEMIMVQYILSKSCNLPCYLSITPGKTSLLEARSIMDNIGAIFLRSYQGDLLEYFYVVHFGLFPSQAQNGSKDLYQSVSLDSENNEIMRLVFGIDILDQYPIIQNYWKIYSMDKIINSYGTPDKILFSLDVEHYLPNIYFEILYYYLKYGIEIEMEGLSGDNQICLDISHITGMKMTLTDISTMKNIFNPSWIQPSNTDYYSSINQVLGLNENELSRIIVNNPTHCFNIISTKLQS